MRHSYLAAERQRLVSFVSALAAPTAKNKLHCVNRAWEADTTDGKRTNMLKTNIILLTTDSWMWVSRRFTIHKMITEEYTSLETQP